VQPPYENNHTPSALRRGWLIPVLNSSEEKSPSIGPEHKRNKVHGILRKKAMAVKNYEQGLVFLKKPHI
jgi:hypothetical protein